MLGYWKKTVLVDNCSTIQLWTTEAAEGFIDFQLFYVTFASNFMLWQYNQSKYETEYETEH